MVSFASILNSAAESTRKWLRGPSDQVEFLRALQLPEVPVGPGRQEDLQRLRAPSIPNQGGRTYLGPNLQGAALQRPLHGCLHLRFRYCVGLLRLKAIPSNDAAPRRLPRRFPYVLSPRRRTHDSGPFQKTDRILGQRT